MRQVLRKEKKFLLDMATAKQLEAHLAAVLRPDPHDGAQGYPVRSLYFDTLHDRDFTEKLWGTDPRRKVRLRVYSPQADFALLELKQKQGEHQLKRGLRVSRQEARALIEGDFSPLLQHLYAVALGRHASYGEVCYAHHRGVEPCHAVGLHCGEDGRDALCQPSYAKFLGL